ncbi:MAG TPA: M56 family metallopeptidase [Ruminiclostridium sp.]|nr:M56 family metallopeptidase [Ruminiclostridium sp.]
MMNVFLINRIFDWIVFSSVTASLIILVILLLKLIFKNRLSPAWHYFIWFLVLVRLLIPYSPESPFSILNLGSLHNDSFSAPVETVLTGRNLTEGKYSTAIYEPSPDQVVNRGENSYIPSPHESLPLKTKIALIWLAGVLIYAMYILLANIRFSMKIRNNPRLYRGTVKDIFDDSKAAMNVRISLPIIISSAVSTPSICGFIKPKILLPAALSDQVSENDLKNIFLHELAHLKRKDILVNWIVVLLKILHWFNPILWYGFYKMHLDCEISCDALVLSKIKPGDHTEYGYTILHLMEIMSVKQRLPGVSGIVTDTSHVKRRITMIAYFKKRSAKWSAIGVLLLIILAVSFMTAPKTNTSRAESLSSASQPIKPAAVQVSQKEESSNKILLMDVKGKSFSGKMLVIPDPKKIAVGFDLNIDRTTSELSRENKAVCAVNAGGYITAKQDKGAKPLGVIIHDGKVIYNESGNEWAKKDIVGFTDKGKLISGRYSVQQLKEAHVREAISFGPTLIADGKPTITKGDGGWGLGPRTAIGQKADGTVLMLVIDGRSIKSLGASMLDVQNVLMENGAVNAANLDGGSSSTMFYNDKVINNPCDSNGERKVPSVFMVQP